MKPSRIEDEMAESEMKNDLTDDTGRHKHQFLDISVREMMLPKETRPSQQLLFVLLACLTTKGANAALGDVLWEDTFSSSSLKTENWSFDTGRGEDGWGNRELQSYTSDPQNVNVNDQGQMAITAIRNGDGSGFTSGRIKTKDKMEFLYGTLEASIKVPNVADGLWPAFWTLGYNFQEVDWPRSGEIDIMEIGQGLAINEGLVNRRVISGAHWEHEEAYATYAVGYDFDEDLYLQFRNYTMDWTPTLISTYVDGEKIWEMDISASVCTDCEEFHHPHYVLFNLAVGGYFTSIGGSGSSGSAGVSSSAGCVGSASAGLGSSSSGGCGEPRTDVSAELPATMLVDYVRVIDNGYTRIETIDPPEPPFSATEAPAPSDNVFDRVPTTDAPVAAYNTPVPVASGSTPSPMVVSPTPSPSARRTPAPFPEFEFGDEDDYDDEDYDVDCADEDSGKGKGSSKGSRRRGRRLCNDSKGKGGKGKSSKSSKSRGSDLESVRSEYLASNAGDQGYNRLIATGSTVAALAATLAL